MPTNRATMVGTVLLRCRFRLMAHIEFVDRDDGPWLRLVTRERSTLIDVRVMAEICGGAPEGNKFDHWLWEWHQTSRKRPPRTQTAKPAIGSRFQGD
jgi:hypothetical protein